MKKSDRSLLLNLAVLALILAGLAAYYFLKIVPDSARKDREGKVFLLDGWTPSSISALEISVRDLARPDSAEKKLVLERSVSGWILTFPWKDGADPETVQQVLGDLIALKSERVLVSPGESNRESADDDRAELTVRIGRSAGTGTVMASAGATADGRYRYVTRTNDRSVYLVFSYKLQSLFRDPAEFRDKTVFDISPSDIREFRIENSSGARSVFRKSRDGRSYDLIAPARAPARSNRTDVRSLLVDLTGLKVIRFPAESGQTKYDHASVRLITGHGKTQEIRIGLPDGQGEYPVRITHRNATAIVDGSVLKNILDPDLSGPVLPAETP